MLKGILQVISQPGTFFKDFESPDHRISLAFVVALIVAFLSALVAYYSAVPAAAALPQNSMLGQLSLISAPLLGFTISLFTWLLYGLLIRIGAGMEVKPWALAAYSSAPQIPILALLLVIAALFPVSVSPISANPTDPGAFSAANIQLQTELASSVYGRSSQVFSYFAFVWQLLLIYLGASVLSSKTQAIRATLLVTIPALLVLLAPWLMAGLS